MNKENLKSIFWDYEADYSSQDLYRFLLGEIEIKNLNRNQVAARLLVSVRWYDLVDIFGIKTLYTFLSDDVLRFIWKKSVRERYKNVREILQ